MRLAIAGLLALVSLTTPAPAHDWYPSNCCSGHDCRPIRQSEVETTPLGFFIKENRELIPYTSSKIKQTPPEGGGMYHRCSKGGTSSGETICIYIPNWGT